MCEETSQHEQESQKLQTGETQTHAKTTDVEITRKYVRQVCLKYLESMLQMEKTEISTL